MLPNISRLNDLLWTGGDLHPAYINATLQMNHIVEEGIRVIIDTRYEWNDKLLWADHPEIRYYHLGVDDHGGEMPDWWWREGMSIVRQAVANDEPVLIHCHMGVNRGPSLAGIALVDVFQKHPLAAWETIRRARPYAWAVYMPCGLRWMGRDRDAAELDRVLKSNDADGEVSRTIGVIRKLQKSGVEVTPALVAAQLEAK